MKKIASKILIMLLTALILAACGSLHAYYDVETDVYVGTHNVRPQPAKIAIIANDGYFRWGFNWPAELANRHGAENVLLYTWQAGWRDDVIAEWTAIINEIAQNPAIRVLIIDPAGTNMADIVAILCQQRDDIFIAYTGYRHPFWRYPSPEANLVLDFDVDGMARAFPAQAYAMGAQVLVYFCNSYVSDRHRMDMMRDKSTEIGLLFVEVDTKDYIQCGSSAHMFIQETLPPLMEEHGTNIVFFGPDNERVLGFWSWSGLDYFIYLPIYSEWLEPHPLDIAHSLRVVEFSSGQPEETYNIAYLIEGIREALEEREALGRVASWPVSMRLLLPLAAAEYGLMWAQGEVPQEGIDMGALEQIMVDIIAEYTGLQYHGVTLTSFEADGATHDNFILVLPDWLVY